MVGTGGTGGSAQLLPTDSLVLQCTFDTSGLLVGQGVVLEEEEDEKEEDERSTLFKPISGSSDRRSGFGEGTLYGSPYLYW